MKSKVFRRSVCDAAGTCASAIRPFSLQRFAFLTSLVAALSGCGGGGSQAQDPAAHATAVSSSDTRARALLTDSTPPISLLAADPAAPGAIGKFYVPYASADIEAAETPISLAFLNDHKAGSRGQISNVGGKLFVGGQRIRLYGVMRSLGANTPSKADAIRVAARLRKEGFNAVRMFAWDAPLAIANQWSLTHESQGILNSDQTLNPVALDYFDHFVYQLQQAGIYVMLQLHAGRTYKEAPDCVEQCQGLDAYLPALIQSQKDFASTFLNHVNLYTGRAYKNDPGVLAIEMNNENSLLHRWASGSIDTYLTDPVLFPKYGAPLEALWRTWAQKKYGTASAAATAWSMPLASFSALKGQLVGNSAAMSTQLYRDWWQFITEIDDAYAKEMNAYLKNTVGVTSLVISTQAHYTAMTAREGSDIADFHSYFGDTGTRTGIIHTNGRPVFEVENRSVLSYAEPKETGMYGTHPYKDLNKPNIMSEFVSRMGNQYMAESEPLVSAYAGFQDIDAIFLTDSHQMNRDDVKEYYSGYFNVSVSSVARVAAVLSFRRGDVTPGEPFVLKQTKDSIYDVAAKFKTYNPQNFHFGGQARAAITQNMYQQVVDTVGEQAVVNKGLPVDGVYTSTTGQIVWKPLDRITVNTPMTKTAIGYFKNTSLDFGSGIEVTVGNTMNNYAVVQMTSLAKGANLPSSKMLLSLTGHFTVPGEYPRPLGSRRYSWGDDYPRIEAVPATVRITTANTLLVSALDSTGAKKFSVPVASRGGVAEFVTGPAYDTGWYLIEVSGNSVPTVEMTAPSEILLRSAVSLAATASDGDGSISKVEFYDGATLIGTDTSAPYGLTWTPGTAGVHNLTARATDNVGATTTSSPVTMTVYASNVAPTVTLTAPATAVVGVDKFLSAAAADSDGRIVKVEFYDGNTLIDTDTTAPYSTLWTPTVGGVHNLTARATDNLGATTTSAVKTSTVTGDTNKPPAVSLTAPATANVGTAVTLSASASDADGTIAKVEFYDGATLIGADTTAPYSISWTPAVAGTHVLTARATDNGGATTTSTASNVVVSTVNVPPTVSFDVAPATATVGVAKFFSAIAADSDGAVTKVEFYANGGLIGTDTTAPYSVLWTPLAAGTYNMTARATDNRGATTTTAASVTTVSVPVIAVPTVALVVAPATAKVGVKKYFSASAFAAAGTTIAKVEFYVDGQLIATDTTDDDGAGTYSTLWLPTAVGTRTLTARAVDARGGTATTGSRVSTVSAP